MLGMYAIRPLLKI